MWSRRASRRALRCGLTFEAFLPRCGLTAILSALFRSFMAILPAFVRCLLQQLLEKLQQCRHLARW